MLVVGASSKLSVEPSRSGDVVIAIARALAAAEEGIRRTCFTSRTAIPGERHGRHTERHITRSTCAVPTAEVQWQDKGGAATVFSGEFTLSCAQCAQSVVGLSDLFAPSR